MHRELETERLLLRPFRPSDAGAVQALCGNRNVARMTARIPHPYPDGLAESWIASTAQARELGQGYSFCLEQNGAPIGAAGLERTDDGIYELGYWLGEPWWGRGLASEAVRRVVRFAFDDLSARQVTAGHFVDNPASGRVLEKCGFAYTGENELWCEARGRWVDCRRLALAKEDARGPRTTP